MPQGMARADKLLGLLPKPAQLVLQADDFANHQQGRGWRLQGQLRKVLQCACAHLLGGQRALADDGYGRSRAAPVRLQGLRQLARLDGAHVDQQRLLVLRKSLPVQRLAIGLAVAGNQGGGLRVFAVGNGNARISGSAQCGGDAGHHVKRNACGLERLQLFAAAAKYKGVAALEPHHALACLGLLYQQAVDGLLPHGALPGPLAHEYFFGFAAHKLQHLFGYQCVVQHHIGLLDALQRLEGQQACIARASANQRYLANHGQIVM